MITLTTEQKDLFVEFLKEHSEKMLAEGLEIKPIEFKTGWMLPEMVLEDERCAGILKKLQEYSKRSIAESELKLSEVSKNQKS